jgi:hypothetical protein
MEEKNVLTAPNSTSISLLHGILISAFLLTRAGVPCTIRRAGELVLLQDEREQTFEVQRFIHKIADGPKGDDKYWIRMRNELLWLRNWGADEISEGTESLQGRGIFGTIRKDFLEMEVLKALLANTRKHIPFEKLLTEELLISSITKAIPLHGRFTRHLRRYLFHNSKYGIRSFRPQ